MRRKIANLSHNEAVLKELSIPYRVSKKEKQLIFFMSKSDFKALKDLMPQI